MKRAVLADTGPLYALTDPSDQHHGRAAHELAELEQSRRAVLVTFATLCETQALVLRRLGTAYTRQWLVEMLEGAVFVNPEYPDYTKAASDLRRFPGHAITLVDAVTSCVSERLGVPVWTFDRHFEAMRSSVWISGL